MSCENCFKGSLLPGEPQGSFVDGAYFHAAAAPAVEGEPKRAVVLLSDIFGLPLKNCKILADIISERVGVDVWVPDLFDGASRVEHDYRFMLTSDARQTSGNDRGVGATFARPRRCEKRTHGLYPPVLPSNHALVRATENSSVNRGGSGS